MRPLLYEGMIVTSGDAKVTALDYATGERVWKTPLDFHRQLLNRTFGLKGNVLVGSIAQKILAWDIETGAPLW